MWSCNEIRHRPGYTQINSEISEDEHDTPPTAQTWTNIKLDLILGSEENFEIGSNFDTHTSCLFNFFYIPLREQSVLILFPHNIKVSPRSNVINSGSFCSLPSSSSSDKFCNFPSWSRVVIFPSASFYSLSIKMMAPSWQPGLTLTGRIYAVKFDLNPARGGAITADVQGVLVSSSAANRLIGEIVQSQRRPLLEPTPVWKRLLALSHLRHY